MSNQALGEWTNVGGAIDMKVYTEELDKPLENIPMNLATPQVMHALLPPSPALHHFPPNLSPLQSSAVTSVIVEPFDRVAINPSPSLSTTPTPKGVSQTPGCITPTLSHLPSNKMAMDEDSPIKPVISSHKMPIKRKIRLEMKCSEVIS